MKTLIKSALCRTTKAAIETAANNSQALNSEKLACAFGSVC